MEKPCLENPKEKKRREEKRKEKKRKEKKKEKAYQANESGHDGEEEARVCYLGHPSVITFRLSVCQGSV